MNKAIKVVLVILILVISFLISYILNDDKKKFEHPANNNAVQYPKEYINLIKESPLANSFNFPVGPPNAKGYYNAQIFGKNNHLGDDWNGSGGGNSDLGDPVFSIANGLVVFAKDLKGGWGNVVIVLHNYGTVNKPILVESLYAHLKDVFVSKGDHLSKGKKIGTIGNANGRYLAHLHFEIRSNVGMPVGGGYSENTKGYLDPTEFIKNHRKL